MSLGKGSPEDFCLQKIRGGRKFFSLEKNYSELFQETFCEAHLCTAK
jgi:hypothetical protein